MDGTLLVASIDTPVNELALDIEMRKHPIICVVNKMSEFRTPSSESARQLIFLGIS